MTKEMWSNPRKQLSPHKCGSCLWKTAYTDLTGFLDISGKAVRCPACNTGIIKVNETPQGHNEDYIPESYLDFVLSDW
jgi:hypothetical protein